MKPVAKKRQYLAKYKGSWTLTRAVLLLEPAQRGVVGAAGKGTSRGTLERPGPVPSTPS